MGGSGKPHAPENCALSKCEECLQKVPPTGVKRVSTGCEFGMLENAECSGTEWNGKEPEVVNYAVESGLYARLAKLCSCTT